MTVTFDPSTDYTIFDGAETLSFTSGFSTSDASVTGLRAPLNRNQIAMLGSALGTEGQYITFSLFAGTLASGAVPKNGDTLTDAASIIWMIISVFYDTLTKRYECVCLRQV